MKTALITGVTGQDGGYLAEFLLKQGYTVYGTHRPAPCINSWRLEYLGVLNNPRFHLVESDLTNLGSCKGLIEQVRPGEIYNLAAQSFVGLSFIEPFATAQISGVAVLNLLEAIRVLDPTIRFYQASSSELFGLVQEIPQTEKTPFYPRSP